jgi:hypothetical protein
MQQKLVQEHQFGTHYGVDVLAAVRTLGLLGLLACFSDGNRHKARLVPMCEGEG